MSFLGRKSNESRDYQREMIDETSRWLSWALSEGRDLPRIPTRMSDHGGFSSMMKMAGAKKLVARWWARVIDKLPDR